jgi:ABC-type transport system substrate-binding protein
MEPLTDVRVRQALNYAVDKEEIAEFVLGGAVRVSDAPIAPRDLRLHAGRPTSTTPSAPVQLLAEAGFPDGFTPSLYSPTGRYPQDIQVSEAIQSQLAEVGINAEIETHGVGRLPGATNAAGRRERRAHGAAGLGHRHR